MAKKRSRKKASGKKRATKKQTAKKTGTKKNPAKKESSKKLPPGFHKLDLGKFDGDMPLPGSREMQRIMQQALAGAGLMDAEPEDSPAAEAERLLDKAYHAPSEKRARDLANAALKADPNCADAYALLAELAPSVRKAVDLYEQGVAAGKRAIGKDFKELEREGVFWGVWETRPYMRVRLSLAHCLWQVGRRDESIDHLQEMLRLNPGDNQGVRHILIGRLLEMQRTDDAKKLLKQYDEPSAQWCFARTLAAYQTEGDGPAAGKALKEAMDQNEHVAECLTGLRRMPDEPPGMYQFGDESEAWVVVNEQLPAWRATRGALTWLRRAARLPDIPADEGEASPAFPVDQIKRLPLDRDAVWQADLRAAALPGNDVAGQISHMLFVIDLSNGNARVLDILETPDEQELLECLATAMLEPKDGEPCRPACVQVKPGRCHSVWAKALKRVGVKCETKDTLEPLDFMLDNVLEKFGRMPLGKTTLDVPHDPAEIADSELASLPQREDEIWQADVRQLAGWIRDDDDQLYRPWARIVVDRVNDLFLGIEMMDDEDVSSLWPALAQSMLNPPRGVAHRPAAIEFCQAHVRDAVAPCLDALGVKTVLRDDLAHLSDVVDRMTKEVMGGGGSGPLTAIEGVDDELLADFWAAAAEFHDARPWTRAPGDTLIQLDVEAAPAGRWCASVMGQIGMEPGLSISENTTLYRQFVAGAKIDPMKLSTMSVTYGEGFEIHPSDLSAAERLGWPVADEEAYPMFLRIDPAVGMRPPTVDELRFAVAALRAVRAFLEGDNDDAREVNVTVAGEPRRVRLAWMDD